MVSMVVGIIVGRETFTLLDTQPLLLELMIYLSIFGVLSTAVH